jgi:hypothetical protein
MREGYDVAQICANGHVANSTTINFPRANKDYCDKCGEKTMSSCPGCQQPIRGAYWGAGVGFREWRPPAYCIHCGKAFPWTERQMQAAIDLFIDETTVSEEEKREFAQNIQAVAQDTPSAQVASNRIIRALKKVGEGTAGLIYNILKDIASEAAKKALFPE